MRVTIDGVEYVPAATSSPSVEKLLEALALQYHTPETLEEYGTKHLKIVVAEAGDFRDDGETFEQFAARVASMEQETE
ncbi:hypothetical protein SEA_PIPPA_66 [Arthrobacter phage Pippa]|nr:hypothetical protein SEA_PIPPA_66 [Arthrobacter phage Pippa]